MSLYANQLEEAMNDLIHVQIGHIYIYIGMQHQSEILQIVSEEEKHLRLEKKSLEE